ncbi:chemotaxis protein CheB [Variovorax sp. J22G73]|uniref:chemotaxis protein CheB n=1 Tax=unclassified Variovorax TaxID=663243 RepID=UPI0025753D3A|nr:MULTISPECIES: chemotaxis protein CheB [unclassified Variovorax]MDM0009499.1 chemotaxis protein CheB [Variovorax sp. J22R203]MDM0102007.1 chemotaxis protein CheB [Variovorax sp. J22G73]
MGTPFRLIVVAASSGGLEAFERIVGRFAPDFHGAIAAVIDTGDEDPGRLIDNLKRHTALQVGIAQEGEPLSHGRIVLPPPGSDLVVRANRRLGLEANAAGASAVADRLFASAARAFGRQVIGVVLTGAGADGSAGLVEVKKHGGRCVVQSPSDAKVPGMPISAIVHDSPDHIVLLDDIAPLLIDLIAA